MRNSVNRARRSPIRNRRFDGRGLGLALAAAVVIGAGLGVFSDPIPAFASTSWQVVATPSPNPSRVVGLNSVSCSKPRLCFAVGSTAGGPHVPVPTTTLIQGWNGSVWSIVPSPNADPNGFDGLDGVSCTRPTFCVAVGTNNSVGPSNMSVQKTLVETWNGSVWSIVPSPNTAPTVDNRLSAVSCSQPTFCVAVGAFGNSDNQTPQTLVELWNGSVWSIAPSPNSLPTQPNQLAGVTCTSPTFCIAVGDYRYAGNPPSGISQTLIESWNGSTWSIVPSPNTSPAQHNSLAGVSCVNPTACFAVGSGTTITGSQTVIESWNGAIWSIVPSPNTSGAIGNGLGSVSCNKATACVAVGASDHQTLIETLRGTKWNIISSTTDGSAVGGTLAGVSCKRPSICAAVGASDQAPDSQALIEMNAKVSRPHR
jgi:hypothetical protein